MIESGFCWICAYIHIDIHKRCTVRITLLDINTFVHVSYTHIPIPFFTAGTLHMFTKKPTAVNFTTMTVTGQLYA